MKSQEKFARLARQGASPAEGTAGAEVRLQEKTQHIGGIVLLFPNSRGIFGEHGGADGTHFSSLSAHLKTLRKVCEDPFPGWAAEALRQKGLPSHPTGRIIFDDACGLQ